MLNGIFECTERWIKSIVYPRHTEQLTIRSMCWWGFTGIQVLEALRAVSELVSVSWRRFTSHPRGFFSSKPEGSCRLFNSVWECPYRVVKDTCEFWMSELLGPLVGCWPNRPTCGLLGLGEPRCECFLSCLLSQRVMQVMSLCSKTIVPVWQRWIVLLLFQTIGLLWPRWEHCCLQRKYISTSDVNGQQSLDLRSWSSCVVPFIYGKLVLFPQWTNLCSCMLWAN